MTRRRRLLAPFRPKPGTPEGKTVWREVKVGILARLGQRVTGEEIVDITKIGISDNF